MAQKLLYRLIAQETLHQLERYCLLIGLFFIPITNGLSSKVYFLDDPFHFFLYLGFYIIIFEIIKYRVSIPRKAVIFIVIFTIWQILCLILGLYAFPYFDEMNPNQFSNLQSTINKWNTWGIPLGTIDAERLAFFTKGIKTIIVKSNRIFYISFYVYHLYKNDYKRGFLDFRFIILLTSIIMGLYSFIELTWLKFNSSLAQVMLITINSFLFDSGIAYGWWPPLLCPQQLRSIFREPSYFGIASLFILPFLWSYIIEKKHIILSGFLVTYFTLMIFATNSRTAIVLTLLSCFFLLLSVALIQKKKYAKSVLLIEILTIYAFGFNLIQFHSISPSVAIYTLLPDFFIIIFFLFIVFFTIQLNKKTQKKLTMTTMKYISAGIIVLFICFFGLFVTKFPESKPLSLYYSGLEISNQIQSYIKENILSVTGLSQRSNGARYAYFYAQCNIIKEHPIVGVGSGLTSAYTYNYLPAYSLNNPEVKGWNKVILEKGFYRSNYPALNKYTLLTAENGLPGLLMYLLPFISSFITLFNTAQNRLMIKVNPQFVLLSISLLCLLAAGLSSAKLSELTGLLLGLMFCKLPFVKESPESSVSCTTAYKSSK